MRPTEKNVTWCLENKELIAHWLERRGGLGDGDHVSDEERVGLVVSVPRGGGADVQWREGAVEWQDSGLVWLPTTDDVLEMLEPVIDADKRERFTDTWQLTRDRIKGPYCAALIYDALTYGLGETPTIALMELLKSYHLPLKKTDPKSL